MSIFGKEPARKYDGGDVVTIIGPEAYFHGVVTVRGSLRVEGQVEGNIQQAEMVVVGRNGRVQGDVSAEEVIVGGSIVGEVVAVRKLEIRSGGKVCGNIRTAKLLIEEGAVFEGNSVMKAPDGKPEGATPLAQGDSGGIPEADPEPETSEEAEKLSS